MEKNIPKFDKFPVSHFHVFIFKNQMTKALQCSQSSHTPPGENQILCINHSPSLLCRLITFSINHKWTRSLMTLYSHKVKSSNQLCTNSYYFSHLSYGLSHLNKRLSYSLSSVVSHCFMQRKRSSFKHENVCISGYRSY